MFKRGYTTNTELNDKMDAMLEDIKLRIVGVTIIICAVIIASSYLF